MEMRSSRRERDNREPFVNMGQQKNPEPRFTSRAEYSETPDPIVDGDWGVEMGG
jgi:hypothetical protein